MKYPLYYLNDQEFEDLVSFICEKILGIGLIVFSEGKDGGRDGKFTGRAQNFPSSQNPWDGKFIIQAKHTTNPIASCSDSGFKTILEKEIPKIKEIKTEHKIDYYLVFTNRKLSGIQEPLLEDLLTEETGVKNCIIGLERIQLYIREYPIIAKNMNLNKLLIPMDFYEDDIRNLIIKFSEIKNIKKNIKEIKINLKRIPIEEKNRINNLSRDYFEDVLKQSYSDFQKITEFLEDPKNIEYKRNYENTVSDIQEEITIKRNDYVLFEEIINHLYRIILDANNEKLKNNRKYIRTILHYMYYFCDIGKKEF